MENEEIESEQEETTNEQPAQKPAAKVDEQPSKAHELFFRGLQAYANSLGLIYEEKAGFHKWIGPTNKQKVYMAKQAKEVTYVETTLTRQMLGEGITQRLPKPNGKNECLIVPTEENVRFALELLADESTPALRPAVRQPKAKAEAPANADK